MAEKITTDDVSKSVEDFSKRTKPFFTNMLNRVVSGRVSNVPTQSVVAQEPKGDEERYLADMQVDCQDAVDDLQNRIEQVYEHEQSLSRALGRSGG